ncbi:MAG: hypothetical protein WA463_19460 [Terriglobales bacterium]
MHNSIKKQRKNLFGPCSLLLSAGGLICWYLPYSPGLFWFGVVGLPILGVLSAVIAGVCGARWWFLALFFPAFLLLLVPEFEQHNEISLKGSRSEGVVFRLSGTVTIISFGVGRYSADAQEPNDRRFVLWQIEPAKPNTSGKEAWEIGTIKYGVVPDGYRQTFPEHDVRPAALEPGQVYYVADYLVHRYFEMTNGGPRWVRNPPEEPCFVIQNGDKWVRVPCNQR